MGAREILVPIDFSGASQRACDLALGLAEASGAGLVLLRVVEPLPVYVVDEARTEKLLEMEALLLAARADVLRPYAPSLVTELVAGRPWQEITRVAGERDVELVVMGTHGRHGLSRRLLGSVAERVARTCPRPVLIVPPSTFASREDAAHRLATALAPADLDAPVVVAISRGALPIAHALASALGGTSEPWLVARVAVDGTVVGAVTEHGDAVFETEASDARAAEARRVAVLAARRVLGEEQLVVRGGRSLDVYHRDVVLVDEAAASSAPLRAAAHELRALSPRRLVAVVPLAEREATPRIEREVDRFFYLEPVVGCDDASTWYRQ